MKVFIVGEGPHDIGATEWCPKGKRMVETEGWLQPLLRNLLGSEVTFVPKKHKDIILLPGMKHKPWPPGHGAKAKMAKILAKGCQFVVFMTDADTTDLAVWKSKCDDIQTGFDAIEDGVQAVACVPMSASESWLLSDREAWASNFGKGSEGCPPKPEMLWGERDDPQGNHPKMFFRRFCLNYNASDTRETRFQVATSIQLDELRARCSISFVAFEKNLQASK